MRPALTNTLRISTYRTSRPGGRRGAAVVVKVGAGRSDVKRPAAARCFSFSPTPLTPLPLISKPRAPRPKSTRPPPWPSPSRLSPTASSSRARVSSRGATWRRGRPGGRGCPPRSAGRLPRWRQLSWSTPAGVARQPAWPSARHPRSPFSPSTSGGRWTCRATAWHGPGRKPGQAPWRWCPFWRLPSSRRRWRGLESQSERERDDVMLGLAFVCVKCQCVRGACVVGSFFEFSAIFCHVFTPAFFFQVRAQRHPRPALPPPSSPPPLPALRQLAHWLSCRQESCSWAGVEGGRRQTGRKDEELASRAGEGERARRGPPPRGGPGAAIPSSTCLDLDRLRSSAMRISPGRADRGARAPPTPPPRRFFHRFPERSPTDTPLFLFSIKTDNQPLRPTTDQPQTTTTMGDAPETFAFQVCLGRGD